VKKGCLLHVEDDEDDVMFMALAAEDAGIINPIQVASDGQEAINYLKSVLERPQVEETAWPALVLLDLKLPVVMGFDVLRWIRQQPRFRTLPVLVLSASDAPADRQQAKQLGADAYFMKPGKLAERAAFAKRLKLWLMDQGELPQSPNWQASTA
jgi:CheY-like chemotaxis protein